MRLPIGMHGNSSVRNLLSKLKGDASAKIPTGTAGGRRVPNERASGVFKLLHGTEDCNWFYLRGDGYHFVKNPTEKSAFFLTGDDQLIWGVQKDSSSYLA